MAENELGEIGMSALIGSMIVFDVVIFFQPPLIVMPVLLLLIFLAFCLVGVFARFYHGDDDEN